MTDIGIRAEENEQQEVEETEQRKPAEILKRKDKLKKNDNQIVKLAMADELINMGIPKLSAYRLLNIMGHKGKDEDINKRK